VIRDEDRPTVRAISLQRWAGQFWSGQWEHQQYLAVPTARGGKVGASEAGEAEVEVEAEAEADLEGELEPEVETDDEAELEGEDADDPAGSGKKKK
jgi:hypothetical protein